MGTGASYVSRCIHMVTYPVPEDGVVCYRFPADQQACGGFIENRNISWSLMRRKRKITVLLKVQLNM